MRAQYLFAKSERLHEQQVNTSSDRFYYQLWCFLDVAVIRLGKPSVISGHFWALETKRRVT